MKLEAAGKLAVATANAMSILYKATVFDEVAVVRLKDHHATLFWYHGPRREEFVKSFDRDTEALRKDSYARFRQWQRQPEIGDFHFVQDGAGTQSEAFVKVGDDAYLILGNTELSMAEISKNPRWLAAQKPFVEMCDQFCFDPLELPAGMEGKDLGPA